MGTASGAPRSDDVKGPTFPKKKWPVCQKRTTPVNGASSKMYRVKYLKASPWFAARQVLGTAPTVLGSAPLRFLGFHLSSFRALSVLTEVQFFRVSTNHVWGWYCRVTVGFAPARHPSYSPVRLHHKRRHEANGTRRHNVARLVLGRSH